MNVAQSTLSDSRTPATVVPETVAVQKHTTKQRSNVVTKPTAYWKALETVSHTFGEKFVICSMS